MHDCSVHGLCSWIVYGDIVIYTAAVGSEVPLVRKLVTWSPLEWVTSKVSAPPSQTADANFSTLLIPSFKNLPYGNTYYQAINVLLFILTHVLLRVSQSSLKGYIAYALLVLLSSLFFAPRLEIMSEPRWLVCKATGVAADIDLTSKSIDQRQMLFVLCCICSKLPLRPIP